MDINKSAAEWLATPEEKRDFHAGVAILGHRPGTRSLVRLFSAKGPNGYNSAKLVHELTKLAGAEKSVVARVAKSKPEPQVIGQAAVTSDDATIIARLIEEKNERFRRSAYLHDRLDLIEDEEERKQACEQIHYHSIRVNQIHDILKIWEAEKRLDQQPNVLAAAPEHIRNYNPESPEPPTEPEPEGHSALSLAELLKARTNLRSRVSKAKKKADEKKLEELSAELKEVESLIIEKEKEG